MRNIYHNCYETFVICQRYVMLVPTSHITMAECWIKRNIPEGRSVSLRSLQSGYAVLGVLGPKATELLQSLTLTSLTKDDYPIDTVKVSSRNHQIIL